MCHQVAGRSLNSDNTDSAQVAALDPLRLAKLRAANEIVRASWQYKVCRHAACQHTYGQQLPCLHVATQLNPRQ